jgi:hypothetical protein
MANDPIISRKTMEQIYSTSQHLSGIAPTHTEYEIGYANFTPAYTRDFELSKYGLELKKDAPTETGTEKENQKAAVQAVDPVIFDVLLSNEVNRLLKIRFGVAFIIITTIFTLVSYGIIVAASVYHWQMPAAAITALVIQAPLQMIGILYIMAKNLFPAMAVTKPTLKKPPKA